MQKVTRWISICLLALPLWSCAGGGAVVPGASAGGGSTSLVADFTPDNASPTSLDVAMLAGGGSGDQVTVTVNVTDTGDVYAGGFELRYDSSIATYIGFSAGSLLEQNGQTVSYTVVESSPGRVVTSASRIGAAGGANASGSVPLVRLNFRMNQAGVSAVGFDVPFLVDPQLQDIGGLSWFGGNITAN